MLVHESYNFLCHIIKLLAPWSMLAPLTARQNLNRLQSTYLSIIYIVNCSFNQRYLIAEEKKKTSVI